MPSYDTIYEKKRKELAPHVLVNLEKYKQKFLKFGVKEMQRVIPEIDMNDDPREDDIKFNEALFKKLEKKI